MKKKSNGLIMALYVALVPNLAWAEGAIPLPEFQIKPGLACAEPRQWGSSGISRQTSRCFDVGFEFSLSRSRTVSGRVDTGFSRARRGMGLSYRSGLNEYELARLNDGTLRLVYWRKL